MVVEGLTARFAYVLSFAFSLMPWGYPYSLLFCIHPIGWVPALVVQFCYPAFIRLYQCHISDFSTESLAVLPKCPLRIVRPLLFFLFKSTSRVFIPRRTITSHMRWRVMHPSYHLMYFLYPFKSPQRHPTLSASSPAHGRGLPSYRLSLLHVYVASLYLNFLILVASVFIFFCHKSMRMEWGWVEG